MVEEGGRGEGDEERGRGGVHVAYPAIFCTYSAVSVAGCQCYRRGHQRTTPAAILTLSEGMMTPGDVTRETLAQVMEVKAERRKEGDDKNLKTVVQGGEGR